MSDSLANEDDLIADALDKPKQQSTRRDPRSRTSTSFVLQCAGVALNYATNVVFARAMGLEEFGVFTYVTNWARIGGT